MNDTNQFPPTLRDVKTEWLQERKPEAALARPKSSTTARRSRKKNFETILKTMDVRVRKIRS